MSVASLISDFWHDQLVEHGRQYVFLVLLGLVLSFAFIRMSARLMRSPRVPWWPGSVVSDGGLHVHHLVFGIVLMIAAGTISFAGFATGPLYGICAFAFGVGMGLTIDEFALWLHLEDVYWSDEGRRSIDAAVIATALIALIVLGSRPFEIETTDAVAIAVSAALALLVLAAVAVCALKGRVMHAAVGLFVPVLAFYGALRIGKPDSWWGKRFYGDGGSDKRTKAMQRFHPDRRTERVKDRFRDLVGGVTEERYRARVERAKLDSRSSK